ncbi:hypothetical protein [Fischerella major]|uniref:hypothetical protein n=1 Tax=Fischerella major TaxID=210993 RepID=UPI000A7D12D6|nr:hypothetical protein [Fischerella major]
MMENQSLNQINNYLRSYRIPQLLIVGKAIQLISGGGGQLRDGYNGWWIYQA